MKGMKGFMGKTLSFSCLSNLAFIPLMNSFEFLSPYRIHLRRTYNTLGENITSGLILRFERTVKLVLRSNSVTRQVTFNSTKISGKCQN